MGRRTNWVNQLTYSILLLSLLLMMVMVATHYKQRNKIYLNDALTSLILKIFKLKFSNA